MTTHPLIPCPDCSGMLHLKEKPRSWRGGSGFVYLCENWPECRGLMSAHADGRPCGNPADAYTRKARSTVHALFDPLWSDAPAMYGPDCPLKPAALRRIARNRAYKWLAHHMGLPFKECHISMMDVEQLRHVWRTIKKHNPTPESVRAWTKERKCAESAFLFPATSRLRTYDDGKSKNALDGVLQGRGGS